MTYNSQRFACSELYTTNGYAAYREREKYIYGDLHAYRERYIFIWRFAERCGCGDDAEQKGISKKKNGGRSLFG